jgi:hypothetical protein
MAARKKVQSHISIVTRVPDILLTPHDPIKITTPTAEEPKTEPEPSAAAAPAPEAPPSTHDTGVEPAHVSADLSPAIEKPSAINPPPSDEQPAAIKLPAAGTPDWKLPEFAQLAAAVAAAVVSGGILGAVATAGVLHVASQASVNSYQTATAKISEDIASLKIDLDHTQRNLTVQHEALRERVQRAEETHNEPAAQLAKLADGLERLERRLQPIIAMNTTANTPAAAITTGSIPASKEPAKSNMAEGWRVRDYRSGIVVVQNSAGKLFEVNLGTNLPALGRVEAIRREDSRIVVVTKNGMIAGVTAQKPITPASPTRF